MEKLLQTNIKNHQNLPQNLAFLEEKISKFSLKKGAKSKVKIAKICSKIGVFFFKICIKKQCKISPNFCLFLVVFYRQNCAIFGCCCPSKAWLFWGNFPLECVVVVHSKTVILLCSTFQKVGSFVLKT